MKRCPFQRKLSLILILSFLIFFGCKEYSEHTGGVTLTMKEATAPFDDKEIVESIPRIPKNPVLVNTRYQGGFFWTETRHDKIERFRCSNCHNNNEAPIDKAAKVAHGNIVLVHGPENKPLKCFTCHNQDERDFLNTERGTKIEMDHSYQMCGQCHFRQKRDWVGGAHGKRISYWAGKRTVMNCASCHDPHSPKFAKKWPKTYSLALSD